MNKKYTTHEWHTTTCQMKGDLKLSHFSFFFLHFFCRIFLYFYKLIFFYSLSFFWVFLVFLKCLYGYDESSLCFAKSKRLKHFDHKLGNSFLCRFFVVVCRGNEKLLQFLISSIITVFILFFSCTSVSWIRQ